MAVLNARTANSGAGVSGGSSKMTSSLPVPCQYQQIHLHQVKSTDRSVCSSGTRFSSEPPEHGTGDRLNFYLNTIIEREAEPQY